MWLKLARWDVAEISNTLGGGDLQSQNKVEPKRSRIEKRLVFGIGEIFVSGMKRNLKRVQWLIEVLLGGNGGVSREKGKRREKEEKREGEKGKKKKIKKIKKKKKKRFKKKKKK